MSPCEFFSLHFYCHGLSVLVFLLCCYRRESRWAQNSSATYDRWARTAAAALMSVWGSINKSTPLFREHFLIRRLTCSRDGSRSGGSLSPQRPMLDQPRGRKLSNHGRKENRGRRFFRKRNTLRGTPENPLPPPPPRPKPLWLSTIWRWEVRWPESGPGTAPADANILEDSLMWWRRCVCLVLVCMGWGGGGWRVAAGLWGRPQAAHKVRREKKFERFMRERRFHFSTFASRRPKSPKWWKREWETCAVCCHYWRGGRPPPLLRCLSDHWFSPNVQKVENFSVYGGRGGGMGYLKREGETFSSWLNCFDPRETYGDATLFSCYILTFLRIYSDRDLAFVSSFPCVRPRPGFRFFLPLCRFCCLCAIEKKKNRLRAERQSCLYVSV